VKHWCDPNSITFGKQVIFPEPVISLAVEPKNKGRPRERWALLGSALAQEDPSFRVKTDEESANNQFQEWDDIAP
jgi:elongation factor G